MGRMGVNEKGLREIRDVLIRYSQYESAYEVFDRYDMGLRKFADEAESEMREGRVPSITLKAHETKSNQEERHSLSKDGFDN